MNKIKLKSSIVYKSREDGIVLIDLNDTSEKVLRIHGVAADFFIMIIVKKLSMEEAIELLMEQYGDIPDLPQRCQIFLQELKDRALLEN